MMFVGGDPDPTRAIGKQVGWLNKSGVLQGRISYADVVGPLSQLGVDGATAILKDLEENAATVADPTAYVNAAALEAGAALEGGTSAPVVVDPTGKIGKQVGWMNRSGSLLKPISYSDVVGPLSWLPMAKATAILKDLETNCKEVPEPTEYILDQARAEGAPVEELKPAGGEKVRSGPAARVKQQIDLLNQSGKLKESIVEDEVLKDLANLGPVTAMQILKDLENNAATVRNPTGYLAAAARRAGESAQQFVYESYPQVPAYAAAMGDPWKIGKQVGWLNKQGILTESISFSDVVGPLSMLPPSAAAQILQDVEKDAPKVRNPTSYILAAAARAGAGAGAVPVLGGGLVPGFAPVLPVDPTGKIGRQIGWLNKNGGLTEPIQYNDVVEPLSMIDVAEAMKILKDVGEQASNVKNPTGYILAAANRAAANAGYAYGGAGGYSGGGGRAGGYAVTERKPLPPGILGKPAGGKRTWQEADAAPAPDDEVAKQMSREIGRLNLSGVLLEKVSYSDVKPHVEACSLDAVKKILQDLTAAAPTVKSPTRYVIAAAKRAQWESQGKGALDGSAKRTRAS